MNRKDADLLAILLEELKASEVPRARQWLVERLIGASYVDVQMDLQRQLPAKIPLWVRYFLFVFARFHYKLKQRSLKKRLKGVLKYALVEELIEESSGISRGYVITSVGLQWLEEKYSDFQEGIEESELQASYDALKLCKTLLKLNQPLSHSKLRKRAFPRVAIPEKANNVLKATLEAHNDSIPAAFERAVAYAERAEWIEWKNDRWYLTKKGRLAAREGEESR